MAAIFSSIALVNGLRPAVASPITGNSSQQLQRNIFDFFICRLLALNRTRGPSRLSQEMQLSATIERRAAAIPTRKGFHRDVATAYDQAGDDYLRYADGDPSRLYDFDSQYAFGDRCIWELLDAKLCELRATGAQTVRILDLGCGPGTWLRRVVTRACELGFDSVVARGLDIAERQVRRVRELSSDLTDHRGLNLSFETDNIFRPLREADAGVDLCLCLYAVLNHLPEPRLPAALAEIARVTAGPFITTVRAVGSTPTVYVDAIDRARRFLQDNHADRLDVEFQNGRQMRLHSHLFSAAELRSVVTPHLEIEDLRGLDLFHGRFARDRRWNPPQAGVDKKLATELQQLETTYCRDAQFIDHATHLLLVGKRAARPPVRPAATVAPSRLRLRDNTCVTSPFPHSDPRPARLKRNRRRTSSTGVG